MVSRGRERVAGGLRSSRVLAVNSAEIVKKKLEIESQSEAERRLHRALGHPSRARILAILHDFGDPLDAHQLAERIGLHANTVRSHLHMLEEVGLVSSRSEERVRPGRPRIVYEAVPSADFPTDAGGYRLLAQILASHLAETGGDPPTGAEHAGRAWGRMLARRPLPDARISAGEAVSDLVRLLDELGFQPQPEADPDGYRVVMRRCPFGDVASGYEQVVCQVHLGLVRGALEDVDVPLGADWLEPHVEPHVCVVHLVDRSEAA